MRITRVERPAVRVSLTALIDVVFILLFFFMLASRSLDWRTIEVDLSVVGDVPAEDKRRLAIALLVLPTGAVHDGKSEIPAKQLPQWIVELPKGSEVILVPAPDTSAQILVNALDRVRETDRAVSIARVPG